MEISSCRNAKDALSAIVMRRTLTTVTTPMGDNEIITIITRVICLLLVKPLEFNSPPAHQVGADTPPTW